MIKQALKEINFNLDLVKLAAMHIQFLEYVTKRKILNNDEILRKATYRYEKFWLPFCSKYSLDEQKQYYPPLDIAWVYLLILRFKIIKSSKVQKLKNIII